MRGGVYNLDPAFLNSWNRLEDSVESNNYRVAVPGVPLDAVAVDAARRAPLAARTGVLPPPRLHVRVVRRALPTLVRVQHGAHATEEICIYKLSRSLSEHKSICNLQRRSQLISC